MSDIAPPPVISFITICYNGVSDTCKLIESIQQHVSSVTYEIIVVDNASKENEAAAIHELFPTVIAIRSKKNLGFSGGNNLGIEASRGSYLFFINNDTFFRSDGIDQLVARLESNPSIGGVSPKICFAAPPYPVQFAGFTPLTRVTLRNKTIGYGHPDDGTFDAPHPTPYLHGAAMLVKWEVIEKAGMMPEFYFLYYEELDWSTEMTEVGYELWYDPCCTVYHKESQSTRKISDLRTFYLTRNRIFYANRHLDGCERVVCLLYQSTIAAGKSCLTHLLKGQFKLAGTVIRGVIAGLKM